MYTDYNNVVTPIDVMEKTLEMRHMCPTAPDTLRSYPF